MQIYHTLTPAPAPQDSAVALGYFDGVHSGHRAVLGAAVTYAAQHGLTAAAFTFELPGNNSLKGGRILSLAQKHTRVAQLGIAQYWEPSFEEFRALSPEDFVRRVLVDCFHAKAVFCGDNFTFGAYAAGNVALLEQLCAPYGITVDVVPMAQYGGQTVSSTRIRAAPPPASAAAPPWTAAPMPPSPVRPLCRTTWATSTARPRCWSSINICARYASLTPWTSWLT